MKFEIINRNDAFAQGRKRFYTGKPCKYGHDAQRFVTTGNCVACNAARSKMFANTKSAERGKFIYPLHPDDHAAAWAYCQALDLARGYVPQTDVTPRGAEPLALPADIARHRQTLLDAYAPTASAPYLPAP